MMLRTIQLLAFFQLFFGLAGLEGVLGVVRAGAEPAPSASREGTYYEDQQVDIQLEVEKPILPVSSKGQYAGKGQEKKKHLLDSMEDFIGPYFWVVLNFHLKSPSAHLYAKGGTAMSKPPVFIWELPKNWVAGEEEWPQPEKLQKGPFLSWIYKNHLKIRIPIGIKSSIDPQLIEDTLNQGVPFILRVSWLLCDRVCTPGHATFKYKSKNNGESTGSLFLDPVRLSLEKQFSKISEKYVQPFFQFLVHLKIGHLLKMLFFAFFGGVLLNLMPCVFPVLSLKVLSLMQLTGRTQRTARQHAAYYTLGVCVSFWSLGALLESFRFFGYSLGWGFQLQSPLGVVTFSCILFLFALNLLGVFEFHWTARVQGRGGFRTRAQKDADRSGNVKAFWTGVLATWLASPCTAPWMGAALGFAFTQPTWVAFLIFTSLGIGLAAPYVIFCFFPSLGKYLPRSGPWMMVFKQGMGFLLLLVVLWLVWILSFQIMPESLVFLLIVFWTLGVGAWCLHYYPEQRKIRWVVFLLWMGAIAFEWNHINEHPLGRGLQPSETTLVRGTTSTSIPDLMWDTFSEQKVESLRASQKKVLVDFTAAWCLTCQWNERMTFADSEVKKKLKEEGVSLLKADWTNEDPKITLALEHLGRSGVPLYVLYSPGCSPQILPEVLSPGLLIRSLKQCKKDF